MSDARLEKVYEDKLRAGEFFEQAETFLVDSGLNGLSSASRSVLIHNATTCACDAILQAVGLRVTSGERAHVLRLQAAMERIEEDTDELFERLDDSRHRRNEASYAAAITPKASVADAHEAATELLELARTFVPDR